MTVNAAQGARLALSRPAAATDTIVFTASLPTEVTRIHVVNTTAGALTFRIHHVLNSAVAGSMVIGNANYYDKSVAANDTFDFSAMNDNSGLQLAPGDSIGVRASALGLNFHIYGVTASIAPGSR